VAIIASKQRPLITLANVNSAEVAYGMGVEVSVGRYKFNGKVVSCPSILAPGSLLTNTAVVEVEDTKGADISMSSAATNNKVLKKEIKDAILVNKAAVKQYNGREFVYVLEEGMKKQRYIAVGSTDGTNYEVLSGLSEGEKVLID
jgi:multidrug efflux pump subunit AcrA (membrane-fusion protein)